MKWKCVSEHSPGDTFTYKCVLEAGHDGQHRSLSGKHVWCDPVTPTELQEPTEHTCTPDAKLLARFLTLEPDAQVVVRRILSDVMDRLEVGRQRYGELDLSTDGRDWRKEQREEAIDFAIYGAIDDEKRARKEGKP